MLRTRPSKCTRNNLQINISNSFFALFFRKVVTITFRMAAESFKLEVLRTIDMLIASLDDLAMTMINTDITMNDLNLITDKIDEMKLETSNRLGNLLNITSPAFESGEMQYRPTNLLKLNDQGIVTVYTDGSSYRTTTTKSYSGYGVAWGKNHPLNLAKPTPTKYHSNNAAEIAGVLMAIIQAKSLNIDKLCIVTDSRYVKGVIDNSLKLWHQYNYIDNDGITRPNATLWERLHNEMNDIQVDMKWVKAHNRNELNELADKLAKQGANDCRVQMATSARQRY